MYMYTRLKRQAAAMLVAVGASTCHAVRGRDSFFMSPTFLFTLIVFFSRTKQDKAEYSCKKHSADVFCIN